MKNHLDDNKPIFLQIKEQLEDSIINDTIKAGERVPSTNEFAAFYKINPATAAKGINELVTEDILYKRRGVGMFVTENAKDILIEKRKQTFYENFILPLKEEAKKLRISETDLMKMMGSVKSSMKSP
ncbi:GntR family transcriptional regulator [Paucisalibacillus globulus]|uniref:GntR family transcriptional regulator n=1 Tax=Paucisalibacillus globulus TaxID=351095 RepID=UPI000BB75C46|nr:GntR family transcriptional regulator [Paucisalibacillus globulus]